MKLRNVLRIALVAIRRNAVRSALTMLGVIIGVASVIAMIALGSGARAAIDEQIQSAGDQRHLRLRGQLRARPRRGARGRGQHHHPDPRGRPDHRARRAPRSPA